MMDLSISCVLLVFLFPAVSSRGWMFQPIPRSHSTASVPSDFNKCIEVDLFEMNELRNHLINKLILENSLNENYFGLREEDWLRLELLECRLPESSLLKKKLLHVFRILVVALYEAHGTSPDRYNIGRVTPPNSHQVMNAKNITEENIIITNLEDRKTTIHLTGLETYKGSTDKPSTRSTNHLSNTSKSIDIKDNEFAGSDLIEERIPYQTSTLSKYQQIDQAKADNFSTTIFGSREGNNETDNPKVHSEHPKETSEIPTSTENIYIKNKDFQNTKNTPVNSETSFDASQSSINTISVKSQNLPSTKYIEFIDVTDSENISGSSIILLNNSATTFAPENHPQNKKNLDLDNDRGDGRESNEFTAADETTDTTHSTTELRKVSYTPYTTSQKFHHNNQTSSFDTTVTSISKSVKKANEEITSEDSSPIFNTPRLQDLNDNRPTTFQFDRGTDVKSTLPTTRYVDQSGNAKVKDETNNEFPLQTLQTTDIYPTSTFSSTVEKGEENTQNSIMASSSDSKEDGKNDISVVALGYGTSTGTDEILHTPPPDKNDDKDTTTSSYPYENTKEGQRILLNTPSSKYQETTSQTVMNHTSEITRDSIKSSPLQPEQEKVPTLDEFSIEEQPTTVVNKSQNFFRLFTVPFPDLVKRTFQPYVVKKLKIFSPSESSYRAYQPPFKYGCKNNDKCVKVSNIAYWATRDARGLGLGKYVPESRFPPKLDEGSIPEDIDPLQRISDDDSDFWHSKIVKLRRGKNVDR